MVEKHRRNKIRYDSFDSETNEHKIVNFDRMFIHLKHRAHNMMKINIFKKTMAKISQDNINGVKCRPELLIEVKTENDGVMSIDINRGSQQFGNNLSIGKNRE